MIFNLSTAEIFSIIGSSIVCVSMIKYRTIIDDFKKNLFQTKSYVNFSVVANMILIWVIFIAYIFNTLSVSSKYFAGYSPKANPNSVSIILLVGSIYMYSVIKTQHEMFDYIGKIKLGFVRSLVKAIEVRDQYTKGHSEHVAALVELIYHELPRKIRKNISLKQLKTAGLLHDIGKIGINETVLNKDGKLTREEFMVMSEHVEIGKNILGKENQFEEISEWIKYHHENINGEGYYGLKGDEIPMESKIIAVADTFSALITTRPYRKSMSYVEAIHIMREEKNKRLEAEIVDCFEKISVIKLNKVKEEIFSEKG